MKTIELINYESPIECCTLDVGTNSIEYYTGHKKISGFTGVYFRNEKTFAAIYPTMNGPIFYYDCQEYQINKLLKISLQRNKKMRKFSICDYNIEISYSESKYIDFDVWSEEEDIDLFLMIAQNYHSDSFYQKFTKI